MREDYCFKCGVWARLDEVSKLCGICYEAWPYAKRPAAPDATGPAR